MKLVETLVFYEDVHDHLKEKVFHGYCKFVERANILDRDCHQKLVRHVFVIDKRDKDLSVNVFLRDEDFVALVHFRGGGHGLESVANLIKHPAKNAEIRLPPRLQRVSKHLKNHRLPALPHEQKLQQDTLVCHHVGHGLQIESQSPHYAVLSVHHDVGRKEHPLWGVQLRHDFSDDGTRDAAINLRPRTSPPLQLYSSGGDGERGEHRLVPFEECRRLSFVRDVKEERSLPALMVDNDQVVNDAQRESARHVDSEDVR